MNKSISIAIISFMLIALITTIISTYFTMWNQIAKLPSECKKNKGKYLTFICLCAIFGGLLLPVSMISFWKLKDNEDDEQKWFWLAYLSIFTYFTLSTIYFGFGAQAVSVHSCGI